MIKESFLQKLQFKLLWFLPSVRKHIKYLTEVEERHKKELQDNYDRIKAICEEAAKDPNTFWPTQALRSALLFEKYSDQPKRLLEVIKHKAVTNQNSNDWSEASFYMSLSEDLKRYDYAWRYHNEGTTRMIEDMHHSLMNEIINNVKVVREQDIATNGIRYSVSMRSGDIFIISLNMPKLL